MNPSRPNRVVLLVASLTLACAQGTSPSAKLAPPNETRLAESAPVAGSAYEADPLEPLPLGAVARCGTARMRSASSGEAAVDNDGRVFTLKRDDPPPFGQSKPRNGELRELTTRKVVADLGLHQWETFSPDASRLLLVETPAVNQMVLVAIPSGQRVAEIALPLDEATEPNDGSTPAPETVRRAEFSRDGSTLVLHTSRDKLHVFNGQTGVPIRVLADYKGDLASLSPDGRRALFFRSPLNEVSSFPTQSVLIDLRTGSARPIGASAMQLAWGDRHVTRFALLPDEAKVYRLDALEMREINLVTGDEKTIVSNDAEGRPIEPRLDAFGRLAVDPGGERAWSDSALLDLRAGSMNRLAGRWVATSPDGRHRLMEVDGRLELDGRASTAVSTGAVGSLGFSPDGGTLFVGDPYRRSWRTSDCSLLPDTAPGGFDFKVALEAPVIVSAGAPAEIVVGDRASSAPWASTTRSQIAVSRDGERIFVSPEQGDAIRMLGRDGQVRAQASMNVPIVAVEVSPAGKRLVLRTWLNDYRGIEVRSAHDLRLEMRGELPEGSVYFVTEDTLLVAGERGLQLFDVPTLAEKALLGRGSRWREAAVSPDGSLIVAAQGETIVGWAFPSMRKIWTRHGHDAEVSAMAFSSDGRVLATGSNDTTVLLWDVRALAQSP